MDPIQSSLFLGIGFHAVGAIFASTCYTPQRGVKGWSWQTYWLSQAVWCWFLLPPLVAWLLIPNLGQILAEAPRGAMIYSFLWGLAYGVGGTAFGLAIRHIGFSLTYAIAIGLSCIIGTIAPRIYDGSLPRIVSEPGGWWLIGGMFIGIFGIALCGYAGRLKETDLGEQSGPGQFNLAKGLTLAILAGVLSAFYGFALVAGGPISDKAGELGAGVYKGLPTYIFSNTGAFITTAVYCIYLGLRDKSFGEHLRPNAAGAGATKPNLALNYILALMTGLFWYGQFFFYNLGHVRMGNAGFISWGIHMIMLVLFSAVVGVVLKEWIACRKKTIVWLVASLAVLTVSVTIVANGQRLGEIAAKNAEAAARQESVDSTPQPPAVDQ
jgi:L-rhamnose-H+ transport protein